MPSCFVDGDRLHHIAVAHLTYGLQVVRDLAKDRMHPIQMRLRLMHDEELAAAGFYATGAGTEYKIYAARNLPDRDSTGKEKLHQDHMMEMALNKRILLAEGKMEYAGYYTIPFNEKIVLDQGEKFAIIVEIKTPDTVHPVAIEYDAGDGIAQVDLTDGEGYLSHNGSLWEHVEETQKCNLCLKVYTHTEK